MCCDHFYLYLNSFVCSFICAQDNFESCGQIGMQFSV